MVINRRLLPLKAHIFFFFGSMAPILPFVLVLAVQLGIPVALQGTLSAFSLLFTIVGKPLVAALADVFPSYRRALFLATVSIMVASFSAIKFIPIMREPVAVQGILVRDLESSTNVAVTNNENTSRVLNSSKWDQFAEQSRTNPSRERDLANRGSLRGQLLLLTSHKDSGANIIGGRECSFICNSPWFCPTQTKSSEVLSGFMLESTPSYNNLQVIFKFPSTTEEYILFILKSANASRNDDELGGVTFPMDSLRANVSIACKSGQKVYGTGGRDKGAWKTWQFWLLAVFLIVGQLAFNTAVSITDAITVDTVGDDGSYGMQRAWGSIGWAVMAPISGLLVDWWSGSSRTKDYTPAFLLCFLAGAFDVLLSTACLKVPRIKDESNIRRNLWPLLKQPRFFVFCCFVILNGCFDGIIVSYIFVMQEDMAKGTTAMENLKFLQGLTVLVQGAVEAPFMFVCGWFMKRLGAQKVTSLVFFLYVFRLLGLFAVGLYGSVWMTLIPELLNGPCYGLGYTAIVVYAANITPAGTSNTVQSTVNICYESLGYALAMFVGGLIYNQVGGPYMYLMASGVAALTFLCHMLSLALLTPPKEMSKCEGNMSNRIQISSEDVGELKALSGNEFPDTSELEQ